MIGGRNAADDGIQDDLRILTAFHSRRTMNASCWRLRIAVVFCLSTSLGDLVYPKPTVQKGALWNSVSWSGRSVGGRD
jgi:hypothetical protein